MSASICKGMVASLRIYKGKSWLENTDGETETIDLKRKFMKLIIVIAQIYGTNSIVLRKFMERIV